MTRLTILFTVACLAIIAGQISSKAIANLAQFNAENRDFLHD